MTSPQSIKQYGLHRAALDGNDEAIRKALDMGADINSLDDEGRTPVMCAVAGERWQDIDASDASFMTPQRLNAIRIILRHPQISLHCLNAPHAAANGVIPLSMAAWLNFPELVKLLLDESSDTVAVDGLDAHGATALMYAARDNSIQVVQLLLSHGARPDLRDCNSRSSIQYAIPHPQILWLCETVLRRHRWHESRSADTIKLSANVYAGTTLEDFLSLIQCSLPALSQVSSNTLIDPPPQHIFTSQSLARSNKTLLSTLTSTPDAAFLRSILFSPAISTNSPPSLYPLSVPILVNRPDERGWSPIHHLCAFTVIGTPSKSSGKIPDAEILDLLYLAGADVSLFTIEEHYTPLHILTKTSASVPSTIPPVVKELIRDFIIHLVRDLGAPLNARDKNDETCLHLAAEYGANTDVLDILLDLDRVFNEGRVSKMKNSRGLFPSELATQQEIKDCFEAAQEKMDMATIRRGSVSSALSGNTIPSSEGQQPSSAAVLVADELGVVVASSNDSDEHPIDIDHVEKAQALLAYMRADIPTQYIISQMDVTATMLVKHFQARIEVARKEVETMKKRRDGVRSGVRSVGAALYSRARQQSGLGQRGKGKQVGRAPRESEDSQLTRVSSCVDRAGPRHVDIVEGKSFEGTIRGQGWADWFEGLIYQVSEEGTSRKKKDRKMKDVLGEFGFVDEKRHKEKHAISGTKKLKSWWKKILDPHDDHNQHTKSASSEKPLVTQEEQDPFRCHSNREIKTKASTLRATASLSSLALASPGESSVALQYQAANDLAKLADEEGDCTIGRALRTAPIVLGAARKDLERIDTCLNNAEEYLKVADANVERIGRVLKRAVKKRRAFMEDPSSFRACTPTPSNSRLREVYLTPEKKSHHQEEQGSPGFLGYSLTLSLRPSLVSLSSVSSSCSALTTTTAKTPTTPPTCHSINNGEEDEETRTMRRLLLRRIDSHLTGVYDEVDRVANWITTVEDVVGGVKRRTYL